MAHLFPSTENDGIKFELPQKALSESDLENIGSILSKSLGSKDQEKKRPLVIPIAAKRIIGPEKPKERIESKNQLKISSKEKTKKTKSEEKSEGPINLDDITNLLGKGGNV